MRIARMLLRSTLAFASGTLLPACLTQDVQYEAPRNYPPSIETPAVALFPLNRVIQLPDDLQIEGDGGVEMLMALPLVFDVRDPNVDQRLEYRVWVDYDPDRPQLAASGIVRVSMVGDRVTREVDDLMLPVGLLSTEGCHRIEILVSSSFPEFGRVPNEEGDLATATWWVASGADSTSSINMRRCP